jgi:hypothetical protein
VAPERAGAARLTAGTMAVIGHDGRSADPPAGYASIAANAAAVKG